MGYSPDALELRKPTVVELPRAGQRISFLHIERARIWQDDTGVVATSETGSQLRIPAASVSVLTLGNGTSITTPAMSTLYRAGCTVLTTSDGGVVGIAPGRPLTSRAIWAQAQARMWASEDARLEAARSLYRVRYPQLDLPDDAPLRVLRGIEGQQVKTTYRKFAHKHRLTGWKRESDRAKAKDPVNPLLNLANSMLYGAAATAVAALGLNPALGLIHQGAANALLFDLADSHKAHSSIPFAFETHTARDPKRELRTRMRGYLHHQRVIEHDLKLLTELLAPHADMDRGDVLLDDEHGHVAGHRNHRPDRS